MSDERPHQTEDASSASAPDASGNRTLSPELLDIDRVYDALSHHRRRYLCYTLLEGTEWSLTDLATKVVAWENDISESVVTDSQRKRAYTSLYHAHVPKLVDDGIVAFDEETETITKAEHADQVLNALEGIGASLDAEQEIHARGEIDDSES